MPRPGVTYDEVAAIADQILAGGVEPQVHDIRERLGTGSDSTIHRHLTAWRNARPPASSALPQLPASLLQEIERVLTKAVAEARAGLEARLVLSQAEAEDLSDAMGELEVEQQRLQGQISDITAQRDALSDKVEAQATDIVRLTSEAERERQATDLARTEVAHTRLKTDAQAEKISEQAADIARLAAERETEAKARIAAEQASAVKDARLGAMQELLDAARHDIERLNAQVDLERQTGQRERERADEQQKTVSDAREELARLKALAEKTEKKKPGRPKTRKGDGSIQETRLRST